MTDPPKRDRAGNPWSEDDILDLRDGYENGVDPSGIAEVLLRREDEVTAKAAELGLGGSATENAPPPLPLGN